MTFLPIVERELRVAARQRSSFWLRIAAALATVVVAAHFLVLNALAGRMPFSLGAALFTTLTWMSFAAAVSAGIFFTSDCLSEEKREGTLGLLFLTDLRGYDVVLGKLLATSVRTLYALLATFPVLALALLMGGVSGGEFWARVLALANGLFFSLAAGLFVSSVSRDAHKAIAGTILVLVLFVGLLPLADGWRSAHRGGGFAPALSYASPGFNCYAAGGLRSGPFWASLAVTHALGWVFLALASLWTPHAWQQKAEAATAKGRWRYRWRYGGAQGRAARRRRLLDQNPVLWLVSRERWQGVAMRVLLLGVLGLLAWLLWSESANQALLLLAVGLMGLIGLLLQLWMASQASRFFVEARRNRALELLLASPLSVQEILAGQWRALRRLFSLPILLVLALQVVVGVLRTETMFTLGPAGAGPVISFAGKIGFGAVGAVTTLADLIALGWVGMWMGLTSRNANFATLKTFVFVQIIPWFALSFVSGILMAALAFRGVLAFGGGTSAAWVSWFPLVSVVVTGLLTWAKDAGLALWARRKLHTQFRELAARSVTPVRVPPPPPRPRPAGPPPVIASPV